MKTISKTQAHEFFEAAHRLYCDVCACTGDEIKNRILGTDAYRQYIAQDIMSGAKPRKGAEENFRLAKNRIDTALLSYARALAPYGLDWLAYAEACYEQTLMLKYQYTESYYQPDDATTNSDNRASCVQ
ncbi:hypothetical protein GCM10023189_43360 [Nibrella saemangeumensis]|uniref:Uncharacterized protein n=1 Tax=Nibrella saemangeumensis TaxID=1084526 RepID=A0ABP8NE36_9BACT